MAIPITGRYGSGGDYSNYAEITLIATFSDNSTTSLTFYSGNVVNNTLNFDNPNNLNITQVECTSYDKYYGYESTDYTVTNVDGSTSSGTLEIGTTFTNITAIYLVCNVGGLS